MKLPKPAVNLPLFLMLAATCTQVSAASDKTFVRVRKKHTTVVHPVDQGDNPSVIKAHSDACALDDYAPWLESSIISSQVTGYLSHQNKIKPKGKHKKPAFLIDNHISKDFTKFNVALMPALEKLAYSKDSRILFAFDFDNNLVKVNNGARQIWDRLEEVRVRLLDSMSCKDFMLGLIDGDISVSKEEILDDLTPQQADFLFSGTAKQKILKHLIEAVKLDQYVAIVTNNTDPVMIRAFLKYFAPAHYKKIPIIYRPRSHGHEKKSVHLVMAHNCLVEKGRISKIVLTDDLKPNIEDVEDLGKSLNSVLVEAYQTDKYAGSSSLDDEASKQLGIILDLIRD